MKKESAESNINPNIESHFAQRWVRRLLGAFFRRIEVVGLENIPQDRGGLLVSWHPNGMIDPALMYATFPRNVVFGARHGLFKWPLLGWVMRKIGTVPIYRGQDLKHMPIEKQRELNQQSLDQLANCIAEGSFSALFPEGVSHDSPFLQQLKTGAARIFIAAQIKNQCHAQAHPNLKPPVIIPVGLHYDAKARFRSDVLINFHPPIELPPDLENITDIQDREAQQRLTDLIEETLTNVIFATESWDLHHNFQRACLLLRAERILQSGTIDSASIEEKVIGLARIWAGYHQKKDHNPELVQSVVDAVEQYRLDMEGLGLQDHELDLDPQWISWRVIFLSMLQMLFVFLLLPPFVIVGYVINFPTASLIKLLSVKYSSQYKDQASVKLFASLALYPLTWALWGGLAAFGYLNSTLLFPNLPNGEIAAGLFVSSLGIIGWLVMFVYVRAGKRTLRGLKVRWVKRHHQGYVEYLQEERYRLATQLTQMAEGLDLPGKLGDNNRLEMD